MLQLSRVQDIGWCLDGMLSNGSIFYTRSNSSIQHSYSLKSYDSIPHAITTHSLVIIIRRSSRYSDREPLTSAICTSSIHSHTKISCNSIKGHLNMFKGLVLLVCVKNEMFLRGRIWLVITTPLETLRGQVVLLRNLNG